MIICTPIIQWIARTVRHAAHHVWHRPHQWHRIGRHGAHKAHHAARGTGALVSKPVLVGYVCVAIGGLGSLGGLYGGGWGPGGFPGFPGEAVGGFGAGGEIAGGELGEGIFSEFPIAGVGEFLVLQPSVLTASEIALPQEQILSSVETSVLTTPSTSVLTTNQGGQPLHAVPEPSSFALILLPLLAGWTIVSRYARKMKIAQKELTNG